MATDTANRRGDGEPSPATPTPPQGGTTGGSRGSGAGSGGSPHAPGIVLEEPGGVSEEAPPERPPLPRLAGRRHDGSAGTGSGSGAARADQKEDCGRRSRGTGGQLRRCRGKMSGKGLEKAFSGVYPAFQGVPEWDRLEGTIGVRLVQPSCSSRVIPEYMAPNPRMV